MNDNN